MKKIFKNIFVIFSIAMSATAFATPKGDILVLLSSETELPLQGEGTFPSGYYLNEFGVPADILIKAGYKLTVVTPKGNKPQPDLRSLDPIYFGGEVHEMERIQDVVNNLTKSETIKSLPNVISAGLERFDAVFIPGGHAPLIDLSNNPDVGTLLRHFHSSGKPTAAICRGPITLLAAQDDPSGYEDSIVNKHRVEANNWIYSGYKMTIFSDAEEKIFEDSLNGSKLRYYPAKAMEQAGGSMEFSPAWQPHVVVDRELITGQNPFSDHLLAAALIKALNEK